MANLSFSGIGSFRPRSHIAMATPATKKDQNVRFSLSIPERLYDAYAERAAKFGRSAEEEISLRLKSCIAHVDTTPIYFNDTERSALSQITGKLMRNASDVLGWATKVSTMSVEGVAVPLHERLMERLRSRTFGKLWGDYLRERVLALLEEEVGLR